MYWSYRVAPKRRRRTCVHEALVESLAAAANSRSAISEMSLPIIPGLGPTGLSAAPGRLTKAAAQPAASAPEMSQACAAIRHVSPIDSPTVSYTHLTLPTIYSV